jgi:NAD(P)-dependent dehydrogenase (short-subunit alcohol dehydrogenase family)
MKTVEWSEESFDRMIAANLKSVWLCMKQEILQMQAQGGGAIVNTSSILGVVGLPNGTGYVAAKHGVIGLTKTAGLEYADDHIRVNAVCPGFIRTPMTAETQRERANLANRVKSPRWWCGQPMRSMKGGPRSSQYVPVRLRRLIQPLSRAPP